MLMRRVAVRRVDPMAQSASMESQVVRMAVEIPGSAIAEIIRARPTLRVLVDGLDAEGRLR